MSNANIKNMRRFLTICGACLTLAATSSCDRQKLLIEDKKRAEAELQQAHLAHKFYEDKFRSLGPNSASALITIERQAQTLENSASTLQAEVTASQSKASSLEAALKKFKPMVEQYKAQLAR